MSGKAFAFCRFVEQNDNWKIVQETPTFVSIVAYGDHPQVIEVEWDNNEKFIGAVVTYTEQERSVKLRNVSEAKKHVNGCSNIKATPKARREVRNAEPEPEHGPVAFSLGDALKEELNAVRLRLAGKQIWWKNAEMNRLETALLPHDIDLIVHPRTKHPLVRWSGSYGVMTVALNRIKRVSR